jgi:adenine-specific DNA-methyltransferase
MAIIYEEQFMKPVATYQKIRGGYYTPKPIADFLARWAIQTSSTSILEPSCGDGMLLEAAVETLISLGAERATASNFIQGIEFDPQEALKASERLQMLSGLQTRPRIDIGDFFSYCQRYLV